MEYKVDLKKRDEPNYLPEVGESWMHEISGADDNEVLVRISDEDGERYLGKDDRVFYSYSLLRNRILTTPKHLKSIIKLKLKVLPKFVLK
jgi:hypothetical protein